MTYQVKLHKKVEKFLDTQDDSFVVLFFEKVSLLAQDPYRNLLDTKPLTRIRKMITETKTLKVEIQIHYSE